MPGERTPESSPTQPNFIFVAFKVGISPKNGVLFVILTGKTGNRTNSTAGGHFKPKSIAFRAGLGSVPGAAGQGLEVAADPQVTATPGRG